MAYAVAPVLASLLVTYCVRREHLNVSAGLLLILLLTGVMGFVLDAAWTQPRARHWLREHLHEFRASDGHASPAGSSHP